MRIVVTGAAGFLGVSVVRCLKTLTADVVPVTRRSPGNDAAVVCDLGDPAAVCRLLEDTQPDCVVNLAAVVNFSVGVLPSLYPVNTLCPAVIANYCRRHDAYLVFPSSIAVHGRGETKVGIHTPIMPDTSYGVSKWLADQVIEASGCRAAVIRFPGIFGHGGPEHLGLNRAINQARAGRAPTVVGSGSAKRNYLYVEDAALGIRACIEGALTGVFYAGGETKSIRDMLQSVCDVWLPGQVPVVNDGKEACDQLTERSPELGPYRSLMAALEDAR